MENKLSQLKKCNKKCNQYLIISVSTFLLTFLSYGFFIIGIISAILYISSNKIRKNLKKELSQIDSKQEDKDSEVEKYNKYLTLEECEDKEEYKELDSKHKQNEEELYLKSFDDIPKYNLNKNLDEKFIKSITRTKEVEYDKFISYPNTTKKPYDFVVLDFETTGLSAENNEIIQIGAIKFDYYKPVEFFCTYIKPTKKIPKRITNITGITDSMVKDAPSIEEVLPKLLDFIGDNYIVAHNATFDIAFLLNNLYKYNFRKPKNKAIDTLRLCRSKLREYDIDKDKEVKLKTYKLEELKNRFDLWDLSSHDALADCKVCAYVYIKIIKQYGDTYCLY